MRNQKTTRIVGSLTAAFFSAATLAFPFSVLAAQTAVPAGSDKTPAPQQSISPATTPTPINLPTEHPSMAIVLTDGTASAQTLQTHGATVADALGEAGITLSHTDRVSPALSTPISAGLPITVTRVRLSLENKNSPLPFKTVFKMSDSVAPGRIVHGHVGVPGVLTKTYLVGYVNTQETSRKLVAQAVTKTPIPATTLGGIRLREARALPSRAGTYNRMQAISMTATGYSPYEGSGQGLCKMGMRAGYGVVAVDPRVIRLGSRLFVEGYGYALAGDTGGAIKGRRIDLGSTSRSEAMQVGRRHVTVWVLHPSR